MDSFRELDGDKRVAAPCIVVRMTKLFISHAKHDERLVEAVVELLEGGVGVPHTSIFCSSLKGQNIKPGHYFAASIRENLGEATCVLALISEAYFASAFCMCELGAVWVMSKSFLPVLVPPIDYQDLKAVLSGLQVAKISREEDLDELRDELGQRLELTPHSTPRWSKKRKVFLDTLPSILEQIPFKGPVAREKLEKLEADLRSYQMENETLEAELARRDELIAELKNAKDATDVARIVSKSSTAEEHFLELVSAAASALRTLSPPVVESLYSYMRNEEYRPDRYDMRDAKRPIEYGEIKHSDYGGLVPDENNPKVGVAIRALKDLEAFLENPPEEFYEWYHVEEKGEQPDITLRGFWDRHLRD